MKEKNFAVVGYKRWTRAKQTYIIKLDFAKSRISLVKIRRGRESKKEFPVENIIKVCVQPKKDTTLSVSFRDKDNPCYKKLFVFGNEQELKTFQSLVGALQITGRSAYDLFEQLDTNNDKTIDSKELSDAFKEMNFNVNSPLKDNESMEFPEFIIMYAKLKSRQAGLLKEDANLNKDSDVDNKHDVETKIDEKTREVHKGLLDEAEFEENFLIEGEKVILKKGLTVRVDSNQQGTLVLTNYRIFFVPTKIISVLHDRLFVPLGLIKKVAVVNETLEIYLKDYRIMKFTFKLSSTAWIEGFVKIHLTPCMWPEKHEKMFAFSHNVDVGIEENGWLFFDPTKEYKRIGLTTSEYFRLTAANKKHQLCPTYPQTFVVPKAINNDILKIVASHRSKNRTIAVVWQHPLTKATISRCSQPLRGVSGKRCEEEEMFIKVLRECNQTNSNILHFIDARPKKAAVGNAVMGKGYEKISLYKKCTLRFMDIVNIHGIRGCREKLADLCLNYPDDDGFLSKLEGTQWLYYVRLLLSSAVVCANYVDKDAASIVIHCSDGWDRTSQLVALTEIMLDPYYRTLKGFIVCIEKDWLSFGHKFGERHGHGEGNWTNDQRSPIFLHFMDAVYQLIKQFPNDFEFNEKFLLEIMEHLLSCRFGTFLFDCQRERLEHKVYTKTTSLWTYLCSEENIWKYKNPFYKPQNRRVIPQTNAKDIILWNNFHGKHTFKLDTREEDILELTLKYQALRQSIMTKALDIDDFELVHDDEKYKELAASEEPVDEKVKYLDDFEEKQPSREFIMQASRSILMGLKSELNVDLGNNGNSLSRDSSNSKSLIKKEDAALVEDK